MKFRAAILALLATAPACSSYAVPQNAPIQQRPAPPTPDAADAGATVLAPELGKGDGSPGSVLLTEIATGLKRPRDLAFNPRRPDELWIVNDGDDSVVIVRDASTDARSSERRKDGYAVRFMAHPAAIAFGADATTFGLPGTFATCGESRNTYGETKPANDFMGPALWSSDLSIFAKKNPNGLGSHLDMLHNSPLCMGIAHEDANVYWAFGGLAGAIFRYDFQKDNGIGYDDHSDGKAYEYATGQVKYAAGIPSQLVFRAEDRMLYIADTGNSRVAKLDTTSGTKKGKLAPQEPMAEAMVMSGASIVDVVPAASGVLKAPSGLQVRGEFVYVSDNATARITAFTLDGVEVNHLDTGLGAGALAALTFGTDGKVYIADMAGGRILRIDPN